MAPNNKVMRALPPVRGHRAETIKAAPAQQKTATGTDGKGSVTGTGAAALSADDEAGKGPGNCEGPGGIPDEPYTCGWAGHGARGITAGGITAPSAEEGSPCPTSREGLGTAISAEGTGGTGPAPVEGGTCCPGGRTGRAD